MSNMDVEVSDIDLAGSKPVLSLSHRLKQGFRTGLILAFIHFVIMMWIALVSSGRPFKRRDQYNREELDKHSFVLYAGSSTAIIFLVGTYLAC